MLQSIQQHREARARQDQHRCRRSDRSTTGACSTTEPPAITRVLEACRRGDNEAYAELVTLVYNDLRRIAHQQLRWHRPTATLSTTGLVHDAYLKLARQSKLSWRDRRFFLLISAHIMRQIIVDYAKRRRAQKRGGDVPHEAIEAAQVSVQAQAELTVMLDEALAGLASVDRRLVRVVECRHFAGYTEEETAIALKVSVRTVQRDWRRARAWLRGEVLPQIPSLS